MQLYHIRAPRSQMRTSVHWNWSFKQVWASIQVLVPELGPLQEKKIL